MCCLVCNCLNIFLLSFSYWFLVWVYCGWKIHLVLFQFLKICWHSFTFQVMFQLGICLTVRCVLVWTSLSLSPISPLLMGLWWLECYIFCHTPTGLWDCLCFFSLFSQLFRLYIYCSNFQFIDCFLCLCRFATESFHWVFYFAHIFCIILYLLLLYIFA